MAEWNPVQRLPEGASNAAPASSCKPNKDENPDDHAALELINPFPAMSATLRAAIQLTVQTHAKHVVAVAEGRLSTVKVKALSSIAKASARRGVLNGAKNMESKAISRQGRTRPYVARRKQTSYLYLCE